MARFYNMLNPLVLFLAAMALVVSATLAPISNKNIQIKSKSLGRIKEHGLSYANFKCHRKSYLKLDKAHVVLTHNVEECGISCVTHYSCLSFNIAIRSDKYGHYVCELLANDKYNEPSKFVASENFNHFSIATPCSKDPCKNSARCIPRYEEDNYICVCVPGYTGRHCETDSDDCSPNPCQNNGYCKDLVNNFECNCTERWIGKICDLFYQEVVFDTKNNSGRYGTIQEYVIPKSGWYKIKAGGARGGSHCYNYGYNPGTYYGGKGATMEGRFNLTAGTVLKIVVGQRGGNSVEVKDGQKTSLTAAQLGLSVEDNAGTGGGGGTFVYKANNALLVAAGGGGGASSGSNGIDGQAGTNGTGSHGSDSRNSRAGGSGGQPGQCNSGGNYHGGVGAGWLGQGCDRAGSSHGERGGSLVQGWVGGQAGSMNSGYNGGPPPGAVGGFGGGGGGSEDNGASGGGGGYSGGGSGIYQQQAGGGGGSYCAGSGMSCHNITGGNTEDNGFVQIDFMGKLFK